MSGRAGQSVHNPGQELEIAHGRGQCIDHGLLVRRQSRTDGQFQQRVGDPLFEVDFDHVTHAGVENTDIDCFRIKKRPHRRRSQARQLLLRQRRQFQVFAEPGFIGQRRIDQRLDIPGMVLMGLLGQVVEDIAAEAAFELADQHLAVCADGQVVDAVAVQRQRGADELGGAERVAHQPQFATHCHPLRAGRSADGRRRAAGDQVDEHRRLPHCAPVRVVEAVVVVADDGVLHAVLLDQHGALGALDVEPVDLDVSAGLAQVDLRQLGRCHVALGIARQRQRGKAAVVVVGGQHKKLVGIAGGIDKLRRFQRKAAGQVGLDRCVDAAAGGVDAAQIKHQHIAARHATAQQQQAGFGGRHGHHQGVAIGPHGHAGHAIRGFVDAGVLQAHHLVVADAGRVGVGHPHAPTAAAVAAAFTDQQQIARHHQAVEVVAADRHPDDSDLAHCDGVDHIHLAHAGHIDAAQVAGERHRLDLCAAQIVQRHRTLVRDQGHRGVGLVLAHDHHAGARYQGRHMRLRRQAHGVAGKFDGRIVTGHARRRQHGLGHQAHQLPADGPHRHGLRGWHAERAGGVAIDAEQVLMAAVAINRPHNDLAGKRTRRRAVNRQHHRAGGFVKPDRAHIGHGHIAPGRDGGRQRGADVEGKALTRRHGGQRDGSKLRHTEPEPPAAQAGGGRGQDADHVGTDHAAHDAHAAAQREPQAPKVQPFAIAQRRAVERAVGDARQTAADDVLPFGIQSAVGRAGGAGHQLALAIGHDKPVVHDPPGVALCAARAAVGLGHLALAQEQHLIARLGAAGLHGDHQLQRLHAAALADVEPEGAHRLQDARRRQGQAGAGGDAGHRDAADADRCIGRQRAGADQHGFAGGTGHRAAQCSQHLHAARRGRGVVVIGELGGLHAQPDVGLGNGLVLQPLRHHIAGSVEKVQQPGRQMHHADDHPAAAQRGDQAVGSHRCHAVVAAGVAGAAVGIGLGKVDVQRGTGVGIGAADLDLPRQAGQQGQRAGVDIGLHGEGGSGLAVAAGVDSRVGGRIHGGIDSQPRSGQGRRHIDHRHRAQHPAVAVGAAQVDQRRAGPAGAHPIGCVVHLHGSRAHGTQRAQIARADGEKGAVVTDGHMGLVFKIGFGLHAHRLALGQRQRPGQPDGQQPGAADIHRQHHGRAHGIAIVGLHVDSGLAGIARIGCEPQRLAIAGDARAAMAGAQHTPEQPVAFDVMRQA